ncbi:MAG: oligopeptide ABC transporter ATP-binding protein OppD [Acidiferrobacterales bacterium]|nr:oligopeptide ABC transporter ATP-binding protein OppD [Acidiferrobacterales bacterium]
MAILEVKDLTTRFYTRNGVVTAVDNVSFSVDKGEILGIVGESGSGKSVSCYSLLGLVPMPPGKIESGTAMFEGKDLLKMNQDQLRELRGDDIAMIFQDPMTCLNPFLTIGEQLIEPLVYHRGHSRADARKRAIELMSETGITRAEERFNSYPHEFSGGMRQRVMIAMALITEPKLLIADEPTTALDVTIQAQILELIAELQKSHDLAVIFISHDLAVVQGLADKVVVMKTGEVVERNESQALFSQPQEDYTRELLGAVPKGAKQSENLSKDDVLLEVEDLTTSFLDRNSGQRFKAVDSVSFEIKKNEILGLVGESGSGKSTIGRSILKLVKAESGSVHFDGQELLALNQQEFKPVRRRIQMIFQDPYASLNPRMTVFDALAEPLLYHQIVGKSGVEQAVLELMDDVGLARTAVKKYPHEFSGGQRQRIAIARSIATHPELIVADEPVSALDVTIQKQILELLVELVAKHNLSMLFVSHDLSVVRSLCDRVMVIQHGKLVEAGDTEVLWQAPQQQYTQDLLSAIPQL